MRNELASGGATTWAMAAPVGFELDWPGEHRDLGFPVSLLAAEPSVTSRMAELLLGEPEPRLVEGASCLLGTHFTVPGYLSRCP